MQEAQRAHPLNKNLEFPAAILCPEVLPQWSSHLSTFFHVNFTDGDRIVWTILEAPDPVYAALNADQWVSESRWRRISITPIMTGREKLLRHSF
jgi:hypothetical protein